MAFHTDLVQGDLVIDGFEQGIGASPYSGLTDAKSVNISSVPGEAGVGFKTSSLTQAPIYTNVTATGDPSVGNTFSVTGSAAPLLENNQAILIKIGSSTVTSATGGQVYWVDNVTSNGVTTSFSLTYEYTDYRISPGLGPITGTGGQFIFSTINMALGSSGANGANRNFVKNYMAESAYANPPGDAFIGTGPFHYIIDSNGLVWSDIVTTGGAGGSPGNPATNSWTYTNNTAVNLTGGNTLDASANGNGMVYLKTARASTFDGWLFIWRNAEIDYLKIQGAGANIDPKSLSWKYNWQSLFSSSGDNNIHEAIVTPNSQVVYCDSYVMGQFFQESLLTPFDPTNAATYTLSTGINAVVPINDQAISLDYLNNQVLIGGILNRVYQWNAVSFANSPAAFIFLPENNTTSIVAVAQNAYFFTGNRGRIYISNGSQADLWKKVPDHISGTISPFFQWGNACYNLGKLYFGVRDINLKTTASSNNYGGIWGVDIDSKSIYLSNQMSYGSYAGITTAFLPMSIKDAFTGYGLYAGWQNAVTGTSGVDVTSSSPYPTGQSWVVSDLIPVGTLLHKMTPYQFEFKTTMPLQDNESISLYAGHTLVDYTGNTMAYIGTATGATLSTGVNAVISGNLPTTVQNQQWLLVQAVLTAGTGGTPSYNRLREIRVIGDTVKTQIPTQPYSNA